MKSEAEKERNRQVAVTVILGLQALTFFWALIGNFVFNAWLMVFPFVTCHFIGLLAFEVAFRKQGIPDLGAKIHRLKFYRIAVWLVSYFPVRMLSYTPLRSLSYGLANIFYFPPLQTAELLVLALYLLFCGIITHRLSKQIKKI